jgi:hypothetical protein
MPEYETSQTQNYYTRSVRRRAHWKQALKSLIYFDPCEDLSCIDNHLNKSSLESNKLYQRRRTGNNIGLLRPHSWDVVHIKVNVEHNFDHGLSGHFIHSPPNLTSLTGHVINRTGNTQSITTTLKPTSFLGTRYYRR